MNIGAKVWLRRGATLALLGAVAGGAAFAAAQGSSSPPAATASGPQYYGGAYGGMMGARGMGPGMMYSYGGMGPWMMGTYGMGRGMMGGYGMGPGMMYGYGGMGPGMMYGYGGYWGHGLRLSSQQRDKIAAMWNDMMKQAWPIMGQLREQYFDFARLNASMNPDRTAIDKVYLQIADLQRKLLDLRLQARQQMLGVLTAAQRKQLEDFYNRLR